MPRLRTIRSVSLISFFSFFMVCACSTKLDIPYKGVELNSLEQAANYITTKSTGKKLVAMKIRLEEKPFLLGAFDVRDGIDTRIPDDNYTALLEQVQKHAVPSPSTNTDDSPRSAPNGLDTPIAAVSYLTARAIAKTFGKSGIPVMPTSMLLGLNDADSKSPAKLSESEEKQLTKAIQEKIQLKDNDWAENRKMYFAQEEKKFFSDNIVKRGVITLESGVQYLVIKAGNGKTPKAKDSVTVNYKGTLLDGTEFDSSYKRGKPDTFKLNDMVPGFSQAMTQVPVGTQLVIYVPSRLAYGEKGNDVIQPNAALVFEVELLSVKSSFF